MRSDFPRTTQQSFIIYSRLDRAGDDSLIIPSVPVVWQSAAFTSETGFATASGAYESDAVDITPVLSDGVLSFEVSGKQQGVYHSGSFELTLTTVGDAEAEIEPASATFTIPVVVFGKADLLGGNRTRTYHVGDYVEPFSIVPTAINPVIDYGGTAGALKDVTQRYDSGLHLTHVQDMIQQKTVDIKLGGTAARPGVYLAWVFANQWTEGGQYDNLPGSFDRGNNAVPFIVTILDHDHAEGNLMVSAKATVGPASHYRVVMLTEAVQAFASAEYLYNCEMTQASSTLWAGSYTDDKGEYTITYQYQLRLDGDTWKLEGREIDSRSEDPPPAFDLYDSSAKRLPEQDVPHVNGWTVGIQGLTEFALRAREFPDDPWELFGFFSRLAPSVWEQQPMYCPQFEGLVTAPAVQFDGGYIYSEDEEITNDFEGFEVKKEFISRVVTPYAPPASEKYTYTTIPADGDPVTITRPVRDVAARIGNVPHSLNGDRPGNVGIPGGDPWGYWPGARRITPKNGTSGDLSITASMSCQYRQYSMSESSSWHKIAPETRNDIELSSKEESELTWSGEIDIAGCQIRADQVIAAMLAVDTDAASQIHYTHTATDQSIYYYSEDGDTVTTTVSIAESDGECDGSARAFIYLASGPFTGLCKHQAVTTGGASFNVSGTVTGNTVQTITQPDTPTVVNESTFSYPIAAGSSYLAMSLTVIPDDHLFVAGYSRITRSRSTTMSKGYMHNCDEPPFPDPESGETSLVVTHNSINETINGVDINTGTTHSVLNVNGVVTEETASDPDGSIYESLAQSFPDDPLPPPSGGWTPTSTEISFTQARTESEESIVFGN